MPHGGTIAINGANIHSKIILEIADWGDGIPLNIDTFQLFDTSKREGTGLSW